MSLRTAHSTNGEQPIYRSSKAIDAKRRFSAFARRVDVHQRPHVVSIHRDDPADATSKTPERECQPYSSAHHATTRKLGDGSEPRRGRSTNDAVRYHVTHHNNSTNSMVPLRTSTTTSARRESTADVRCVHVARARAE